MNSITTRKNQKKNKTDTATVREIAEMLAELKHPEQTRDWLLAMLTPRELERICLRWKLVRLLANGVTQREISRRLGISLCKITRGSRELKSGPRTFRQIVARYASPGQTATRK